MPQFGCERDERAATEPGSSAAAPADSPAAPGPLNEPELLQVDPGLGRHEGIEIVFRFAGLGPAAIATARAQIAQFKSLTGISVIADFQDGAGPPARAPDIWYGGPTWVPVLAARDQVLELDDYVDSWEQWDDFFPLAREDAIFRDHIYGVPFRSNHRGSVAIRPSLFEAAGLAPESPRTWQELNEIAARLTIRDGERFRQAGFNLLHHAQVYEDWLLQAGGRPFTTDLTIPSNNTPEGHLALTQHIRSGLIDKTMPIGGMRRGAPNLHAFCSGNVAIQQLWPGNAGNCQSDAPAVFADLLVGPPLTGPGQRAMQVYFDKFMVSKNTEHPDAAFESLRYFASPGPNFAINLVYDRSLPCRKALESFELYGTDPWKTFADNTKFTKLRQIVPGHFDVQPAMNRWVTTAALGEVTVAEALRAMDEAILGMISGQ